MAKLVPVTDHAVLRYMERVHGFDIDAVRRHIWKICEASALIGATCLRSEGVKFEFTNGKVVTVVPDCAQPGKTSRAKTQQRMLRT